MHAYSIMVCIFYFNHFCIKNLHQKKLSDLLNGGVDCYDLADPGQDGNGGRGEGGKRYS